MSRDPEDPLLISYLWLRRSMGVLGIAFPFLLYFGARFAGAQLQESLSNYYYTNMGDVFVGVLCSIGAFLFSYRGYQKTDAIVGKLASVFAIGVAIYPTPLHGAADPSQPAWIGVAHFTSASLLFIMLIIFSGYLFRKSKKADLTSDADRKKRQRNHVYLACAIAMALCILLIAAWKFRLKSILPQLLPYEPVFWLESTAIIAFGISWLIKGETLLKDEPEPGAPAEPAPKLL